MTHFFTIDSLDVTVTCTKSFKYALAVSLELDNQSDSLTFNYVDATNKDDVYEAIVNMVKYFGLTYAWNQSILELGYLDPTDCIIRSFN
jgi:hypothetical protein